MENLLKMQQRTTFDHSRLVIAEERTSLSTLEDSAGKLRYENCLKVILKRT